MKTLFLLIWLPVSVFADIGVAVSSNNVVIDKQIYKGDPTKVGDVFKDDFLKFQFFDLADPTQDTTFNNTPKQTILTFKQRTDKAFVDMNNPTLTPNERIDAVILYYNLVLGLWKPEPWTVICVQIAAKN